MHDHIMCIRDIVVQLKALEVTMSYSFLVHYILCTLPHHYASFKIMCVQEKEMLLMEEDKRVNLTTFEKHKRNQVNHKGRILAQPVVKKESKCFFYKKKGHMKKDCPKFKNWLEKKGYEKP